MLVGLVFLVVGLALGIGSAVLYCRKSADAQVARAIGEAQKSSSDQLNTASAQLATARAECSAAVDLCNDYKHRLARTEERTTADITARDLDIRRLADELTRYKTEEATYQTRLAELERAQKQLKDSFNSLCAEALKSNNEAFLQLARTELERVRTDANTDLERKGKAIEDLLVPIKDCLGKYDNKILEIEQQRAESFGALSERLSMVAEASELLKGETQNLVKALRVPNVRGRWGEIQLKRVCELAGMLEHCDFETQSTVETGDGAKLRPDVVVRIPGGKTIVVDAKAPVTAYIDATEAQDEETRKACLKRHAGHIRNHIDMLSKKSYWEQFEQSPEFVVLFLPGEVFYSAALEQDPLLIEYAVGQRIILANPTTLIGLLHVFAYGWRQESIEQNARQISDLGKEIYERITSLADHFADVGKHLDKAVDAYNKSVGTLESRVMVSARRFKGLGATAGEDLPILDTVERTTRSLQQPELAAALLAPATAPAVS